MVGSISGNDIQVKGYHVYLRSPDDVFDNHHVYYDKNNRHANLAMITHITDNNVASAFRMTAGELTLTDNDQNNNVSFTLTNPNTVYTLSGGTFIFKGQQFENHSANAIATGGKFIFDSDKNPGIAYTAPFYSLHIMRGMVKYSPAFSGIWVSYA